MLYCRPAVCGLLMSSHNEETVMSGFNLSFSLFHDPDEGHKEFLMEAFENQSRSFPGGDFKPADKNWTDVVK